jgi:curved DNA-binding protein CbpA
VVERTTDYYRLLEVKPTATIAEIRRAYRRLVKRYHPDKNPGQESAARERFDGIVRAYEALSDERKRRLYDRRTRPNAYRAERPATADCSVDLCYRVLDLLLAEEPVAALSEFGRLARMTGGETRTFDMTRYLEYGDARDAEFLLAEAFERVGQDDDAWAFYRRCLDRESKRPYFRRFTEDIRERVLRIALDRTSGEIVASGLTGFAESSLREVEELTATDRAYSVALKRLAERVERAGCVDAARELLLRALRRHPKLSGVRRLATRLGVAVSLNDPPAGTDRFAPDARRSNESASPTADLRPS